MDFESDAEQDNVSVASPKENEGESDRAEDKSDAEGEKQARSRKDGRWRMMGNLEIVSAYMAKATGKLSWLTPASFKSNIKWCLLV